MFLVALTVAFINTEAMVSGEGRVIARAILPLVLLTISIHLLLQKVGIMELYWSITPQPRWDGILNCRKHVFIS